MNPREATRKYRLNKWTEIVRECRNSGQTISVWCADHNINPKSYYYWLKRVRAAASEALPALKSENTIIPIDISAFESKNTTTDRGSFADITLHFGSVTVELHNNASAMLIENTLRALQNVR